MIAHTLSQRRKLMRLANQLKFSVILISLLLSGCASLQPRLGFNELLTNREAAKQESYNGLLDKLPVEIYGAVERGSIQLSAKIPVFVW
jgi:hypothetical protein